MLNDENALILSLQQGENPERAFHKLVLHYQKHVYAIARRMVIDHDDANDVVQNTFIKVWENRSKFKNESKLFTWIYLITVNETLGFLNKKNKWNFISLQAESKQLESKLEQQLHFSATKIELVLQKAILKLPQKQRIVFNMRYYEDLKYEEISEIMGTSVGALKANYHNAVKKIEEFVGYTLNQ
jgi:RNA polymerase sigma-70 factor (ECF subfamily)